MVQTTVSAQLVIKPWSVLVVMDNAVAESFFGPLKIDLVTHEDYRTIEEARKCLFEYIELVYNRRRRHSFLGYISQQSLRLG